jgi:hypothetical protein
MHVGAPYYPADSKSNSQKVAESVILNVRQQEQQRNFRTYEPSPNQVREGYIQNLYYDGYVPKKFSEIRPKEAGIFQQNLPLEPPRSGKKHFDGKQLEISTEGIFRADQGSRMEAVDVPCDVAVLMSV